MTLRVFLWDQAGYTCPRMFLAAVGCKRVLDGRLAMPESESSRARKYVEQRADCETETEGRPDDDYPQA